jgi:hypothetical protein
MALTLFPLRSVYGKKPINANALGQLVDYLTRELGAVERAVRDAPLIATRTVTTDTLLTLSDGLCLVDATAGAVTITLPALPAAGGYPLIIKKSDASVNVVTVDGGAANIDGAATFPLAAQWETVTVVGDASAYYVI